jgi:hypothetical protein
VADQYEDTIERYVRYQDHLAATGQLSGYEAKLYRLRRRQELLWKLLLDETVESLAPLCSADPVAELRQAVAAATGAAPALVTEEVDRVLALGALEARPGPEGVRFAWTE